MYKFIDLFCGIGGFRLALEKRGLECVFSSDIDGYAQEAYKKNFGEIPANKIPKHDILCAGFPCQPFSISGKMGGVKDPRGRLFYEIHRIVKYHKPSILLLENVKNILTIANGNVIKKIEKRLNEIGYNLYKHILNASFLVFLKLGKEYIL
jgi:DNA (cytosine-5)-methyltransferase 1